MSNFWLTTDNHFGHRLMTEIEDPRGRRPVGFEDKILKGFGQIPYNDILINLGDFCLGGSEQRVSWQNRLRPFPFKKWLVLGNHDHASPLWYLDHGWDMVCNSFTLERQGKIILFSHKPTLDGVFDPNIHGHFHASDHRKTDHEFKDAILDRHKLLALELTNYQPVKLDTFLN